MGQSFKFRARCVKCDARRMLNRKPKDYIQPPRCKRCGHNRYYLVPPRGGKICDCGGYWFKHRAGSKWCLKAKESITAAEAAQRWGGDELDYHFANHPMIKGISTNNIEALL